MALNNAELAVVLKEVIDPEIIDQVERTPTLYKLIPKGGQSMNARGGSDVSKDGIYMYAKVEPNPSIAWFGEGGKYPVGAASKRVKFSAGYSRVAITSRLTRDVLEGADKSAIINVVTEEITDDTKSILKEISQQLYGDGSGKKAVVAASGHTLASGILKVEPYTTGLLVRGKYDVISGSAADRDPDAGTVSIAVGGVVGTYEVGSKTNSTVTLGSFTKNADTQAFGTFSAADLSDTNGDTAASPDVVAGDMLVLSGSYGKCITGLDYHINSGTGAYQGLPGAGRADYPTFRAYTYDMNAAGLTVASLYKVIFQARYARRNDILDGDYVILSAPTQTHAYALLGDVSSALYAAAAPNNRTGLNAMPNNGSLDYGFRSFKFAGINWIEDIDCPPDVLYVINFSKFKIHEFKPLSKVFEGNGFMPVPGFSEGGAGSYTDNVLYTMTWKGQLVTKDPQMAGIKMYDLKTEGLALPTNDYIL
jgi:hypothetical protein